MGFNDIHFFCGISICKPSYFSSQFVNLFSGRWRKVSVAVASAHLEIIAPYIIWSTSYSWQDFEGPCHETRNFNDDYYGDRGVLGYVVLHIPNSSSLLCCQKLPCLCRTAWRNQSAGATNRIWVCLLNLGATKTMLRTLSSTKQRISILKVIENENDNGSN